MNSRGQAILRGARHNRRSRIAKAFNIDHKQGNTERKQAVLYLARNYGKIK